MPRVQPCMLGGAKGLVAGIRKLAGCLVDDTACVSFNGLSAECARRSIDNRKYRALGRDYICVTVHSVPVCAAHIHASICIEYVHARASMACTEYAGVYDTHLTEYPCVNDMLCTCIITRRAHITSAHTRCNVCHNLECNTSVHSARERATACGRLRSVPGT